MLYIDPVFAIGDFGDVRNDQLELEATIDSSSGSSSSSSSAPGGGVDLAVLTRPRPVAPIFGIPPWVFLLGGIVFLIASSSERT